MARFAFGIELEIANISTFAVQQIMRDNGIEGLHITTDATPGVDCEIVFPPLAMSPFARSYIRQVCALLEQNGAEININCGMHVHISNTPLRADISAAAFSRKSIEERHQHRRYLTGPDWYEAEPMDAAAVRDIVERYTIAQDLVNEMHPRSRRNNRYCRPLNERLSDIRAARTIRDLQNATWGKFSTVNVATWQRGTIEFRQAAGTVEHDKVISWVRFLLNLVSWTVDQRIEQGGTVETTHTTPERPYRPGSRLDVIWRACRRDGGATVRYLMDITGTSAVNIRARISEMRGTYGDEAIITHTQQANGHSYGDGVDLARYEIRDAWVTTETNATTIRDGELTSIWAGMDDDTFEYWQNRIETLAA